MRLSGWPAFNYNTLLSFVGSGPLESAPSSTQSQHTSPKLVRDPTTLGNIFYITQPKVFFLIWIQVQSIKFCLDFRSYYSKNHFSRTKSTL